MSGYKWSKNSQGYIDFSIAGSRFCYKSAEICSAAFTKNRLSRVGNRLSENDINTTTGKGRKNKTEMVFTTTANSSCKKQPLLPVCNVSEPVSYSGTAMVVHQPGDLQWQTYCVSYLQNTNTIRCIQKGLGIYCQKVATGLQWTLQESNIHINVLELLVIKLALLMFSKMFNFKLVHFQVDNMSIPS